MDWLDDSKACLDVANDMLEDVKDLMEESLKHDDVIPYLKVKIKNCLENCRSPLDYAAIYIFDTYCKSEYSAKELRQKGKTYFPIRKNKNGKYGFDSCIKDEFKTLLQKRKEVVNIFESCQQYNGTTWLNDLTSLVNENKHRNLTKQERTLSGHIERLELPGLSISGLTFEKVGTLIQYGDTPMNDFNHISGFKGSIQADYVFSDLNLPVPVTLNGILSGVNSVINDLEKIL